MTENRGPDDLSRADLDKLPNPSLFRVAFGAPAQRQRQAEREREAREREALEDLNRRREHFRRLRDDG